MRIIAGAARGRKLFQPKGDSIRPTSDRVREALFNLLGPLAGLTVLDLFAGTGALGLEALSRGAQQALFVDVSTDALGLVRRNVELLKVETQSQMWKQDAGRALAHAKTADLRFDLAFLDPPYRRYDTEALLTQPLWHDILTDQARLIWECPAENAPEIPDGFWTMIDHRRYGHTILRILELKR